ncbi:sugar diacid recognition domain-containing protein [Sporosarcina sp. 179-K 3D1 HS]|uniref:sugar diacid recognition domain-containing protein n=1 Tax=Sporosarcina sp. 179-K 3D1 HS TaxID=3232169 RepID=UPI0039A1AE3F
MVLKQIAQKISEDTTKIIGFPVSISDENGYLIGVNDKSRIGIYDYLLAEVIKTRRLTFFDENAVKNYPDIFPGVASPIIVNGQVLGAVGILGKTGQDSETSNYIRLVKNHIEMICHETLMKEMKSLQSNAVDTLIHYILNFEESQYNAEQITRYGNMMGFNVDKERICIIIQISPEDNDKRNASLQIHDQFYETINEVLNVSPHDITGRLTFEQFCILKAADQNAERIFHDIERDAEKLNQILLKKYNVTAKIAIGNTGSGIEGIQKSYNNALIALKSNEKLYPDQFLYNYNDFSNKLNIIINSLPQQKNKPIASAFNSFLNHNNFKVLSQTFIIYCESKFNLSDAARSLHLHRNTLIYRMNQIKELTNIDINNFNHCIVLYIYIKKQLINSDS